MATRILIVDHHAAFRAAARALNKAELSRESLGPLLA
jgi:hypothetical protein